MADDHFWIYECGRSFLDAKKYRNLWITTHLDGVVVEGPPSVTQFDYSSWDPEFLEQKRLELMGNSGNGLNALGKKRGRRPIFSEMEILKLKALHRSTRPRDHGLDHEKLHGQGLTWTVELFRYLIWKMYPDKTCSHSTAHRLHYEFTQQEKSPS
jgi:hypothetical protein